MSKIDDIRLKLERAAEHLEHFKAAVKGRHGPIKSANAVLVYFKANRQDITVTSHPLKPDEQLFLGVLIGDVIHQTRACLDHLVYALACRRQTPTEKESKSLWFPICKKSDDFTTDKCVRNDFLLRMVGCDEFTEIENAQPYKSNRPELWILKRLDDIDKHRTILVMDNRVHVKGTAYAEDGVLSQPFSVIKEPVKPETEVFPFGWDHPRPPAAVDVEDITRHVVFTEPTLSGYCDGASIIPMMRGLMTVVNDTLIKFDRFFPF